MNQTGLPDFPAEAAARHASASSNARCLLWDFDNTLAYRSGMWSQCLADVAGDAVPGSDFRRDHFSPFLSSGFPWHVPALGHPELSSPEAWWLKLNQVFEKAFREGAGFEPALAALLAGKVRDRYLDASAWQVYPDVPPVLCSLSAAGWSHVMLSNHVPELPRLVEELGLAAYFLHIFTSAITGYEKPHPAAFANAVKALPADAYIVMVGDNLAADYQGAIAAGLNAVLVRAARADGVVSVPDLFALPQCLQEGRERSSGSA